MRKFEKENRLDDVRWEVTTYSSQQIRNKYSALVESAMVLFYKGDAKPTNYKKFTLHSLRSTHITHNLLNGVRIRVISDNVSTSEAEIERTYYRLNNLLNIEELGMHRKTVAPEDELRLDQTT
jgi:integrase